MEMMISRTKKSFDTRIHEIDFVRGLLIILVLFDHIMWLTKHYCFLDQNYYLNFYWSSPIRECVRQIALILFCLLSGISARFSRNYFKRSLLMIGLWLIIMTGSRGLANLGILSQKTIIDFNIIGVLAFSMLIYSLVQHRSNKIIVAIIVFSFLMWLYFVPNIQKHFSPDDYFFPLWCGDGQTISIPPFGWKQYYADYLPLFPYMIGFFVGVFLSSYLYKDKKSLFVKYNFERPICFLGRHTLVIYITHQIILIPIFILIHVIIYGGIII
ncbi:MAG: DUF1624 domain-containing protein [Bacilli bacterium]|nr:DUF1624 domain-containing protein [Bacilli bacterium]